jgi:undecaprenyl-diphosphatase
MKKKEVAVIIIVAIVFFISLYFDKTLVKYVSFLKNGILDNFFLFVAFISSEAILFLVLTFLFLFKKKKRRWIFPLWLTIGVSAVVSFILKITVQRLRPFQMGLVPLLSILQKASYDVWNFSFPSSHAMFAFCAVPILSEQYPKLKNVWIGIAVLISFSRVYLGLHFFSDVIAGGLIGYIIGILILKLEKEKKFGQKIYDKIIRR